MSVISHILAPTDFSAPAAHALAFAVGLARDFHTDLTIVHAVESWAARVSEARELDSEIRERIRQQALQELEAYDTAGVGTLRVESGAGRASQVITDTATRVGADLIVLGTHGTSAVEHALLGSTAERVVRTAPCSVYSVRYPEHKFMSPYIAG